ncbi:MAG: MCP four helix bundle domain-containing protein, partial [Ignavibacteria bacterium]|nr:MCP four helix bundle domain-containing protein [Ignavibacteria bacterium]
MTWFYDLKVSRKLLFLVITGLILIITVGVLGISSLKSNNASLATVYNDRVVPLKQLKIISDLYAVNIVDATHKTRNKNFSWSEGLEAIKSANLSIRNEWKSYTSTYLTEEEKKLVREAELLFKDANSSIETLTGIFEQQNEEYLVAYTQNELYQKIDPITSKIGDLINLQLAVAKEEYDKGEEVFDSNLKTTIILIVVAILLLAFISYKIILAIKNPINELKSAAEKMALGDVNVTVRKINKDEIGDLTVSFMNMVENIKSQATSAEKIAVGDLSFEVVEKSDKDVLALSMKKVTASLKGLISEANLLTNSALDGDLSKRGNSNNFAGGYKVIIEGLNNTLDAVIKPVKEGSDVLEVMASGDFTPRVKGIYHGDHQMITNSINKLGDSVARILHDVTDAVSATASASNQISSSTEELAAGAQEQSAQSQEIASAVNQMTSTILETSKHANTASINAKNAGAIAKEGGKVVQETVEGMNRVALVVSRVGETVKELGKGSDQIGEIVQVIDDIADQTNLLALNAAI